MFNWLQFLQSRSIPFVTSGSNVARGNVAIHCPFCGPEDASEHLGISLEGKGWACWRRKEHRGKSPVRLISALLGCSLDVAHDIAGTRQQTVPDDFMGKMNALLRPVVNDERVHKRLQLPAEFRRFGKGRRSELHFTHYLAGPSRGFAEKQVDTFSDLYDIYYCTQGAYKDRVIFTVWFDDKLVTWTGRTFHAGHSLRYKTLSPDPDKAADEGYAPALGPITDFLLWYDDLTQVNANTIMLCEGPMDALKVRVLGERQQGVTATCFFTSSPSARQIDLLHSLLPRFKYKFLLLDRDTLAASMYINAELASLGVRVATLPPNLKDPGQLRQLNIDVERGRLLA